MPPVSVGLLVLSLAAPGPANVEAPGRLELSLRAGVSRPLGSTVQGEPLGDTYPTLVSLRLDLGARVNRSLFLGVFGQSDLNFFGLYLDASTKVDWRIGLEGILHLDPDQFLDPWAGLGLGLEFPRAIGRSPAPGPTGELLDRSMSGPVLDVQFGLDLRPGPHVAVGPWVNLAVGAYVWRDASIANHGGSIPDPYRSSVHGWLSAGLRFTVLL